ncbi:unnamed protein product [Merluccius merluccius]
MGAGCNFGGAASRLLLLRLLPFLLCGVVTVNGTTTRYSTYEEDSPGTEIGNLSRDLNIDPADDPLTSFRFMQQEARSGRRPAVAMRESDGLLSVGDEETLDREKLCPDSPPRCLVAFDVVAFSREKFHLVHVEIEVLDVNDHPPAFPRNETRLEIPESAPLRSRFPLDAAVDLDVGPNYIQNYSIISPGGGGHPFAVEERIGDDGLRYAELVLVRELDREVEGHYTVRVTATDGGAPPRSGAVTVRVAVLDVNDNIPAFEEPSVRAELREDAPVGHRVVTVRASDPDQGVNGEVTYALAHDPASEAARLFRLDPRTGHVTLKASVDFETRRSYELDITASDSGAGSVPSTCRVVVDILDVNDNAPQVSIKPMTSSTGDGVAYITEAAAAESFVALISTLDRDSGPNGYVRTSLHGHDHFELRQAYGDAFMIVTTTTLDREKIPEYNLTVVAQDLGSPPFRTTRQYTIRVADENDNAPGFTRPVYDISVLENNVPGSYVTTVVARDPDVGKNAKVSYTLLDSTVPGGGGGHISTYVSIDPQSGSLYTLRSFDYETLRQVELGVRAQDGGSPPRSSTSTVRIRVVDQNDNTPYFTFPVLRNGSADVPLPVDAPAGYLALRARARDEDDGVNGQLSYRIVRGDLTLFAVNGDTGEVALRRWLPAGVVGEALELTIAASDKGRSPRTASATVRLVVSDAEPSEDRVVVMLPSSGGEGRPAGLDGSLIVIVMLSGGCALLLVAIVIVVVTCKLNRGERDGGGGGSKTGGGGGLFGGRPAPLFASAEPNVYTGQPGGFFHDRAASSLDDSGLYEERSRDSETKMFLPSKHSFQPTSAWQGDKYCLQVSIGNTDQFSVKDSGKGDSDFNDSDSDISGDVGKKNFSTFQPVHKSSTNVADTQKADWRGPYCAVASRSDGANADNASYTIGFSSAAVYNNPHAFPHSWKHSSFGTSRPLARTGAAAATLSATAAGTLPSYFARHQQQQMRENPSGPHFVTVASALEVATVF